MRNSWAHIFIILYITAMLRPVMPLAYYVINQDYIADFLCINKDKPELECNGKCYLAEQLKKASEEKEKNLPAIQMEEYPIGSIDFSFFLSEKPYIKSTTNNIGYCNHYKFAYLSRVFHPPSIFHLT
ncbi:hypothetical protein [Kordia sp.]|uniref:hypothetical protein n=1 Tax=Kordia sp. TaxID=1965332 RepID=UPI0025C34376|nr:hypothetical protein [Kordia sp.]MCH2192587.1 hypothetical protein [Kordia sp.]